MSNMERDSKNILLKIEAKVVAYKLTQKCKPKERPAQLQVLRKRGKEMNKPDREGREKDSLV